MEIAICSNSRTECESIAKWCGEYGNQHGIALEFKWFHTFESYAKYMDIRLFPIIILAFDDILNQELGIITRNHSSDSLLIWVGDDKRFGVSSYRVEVVDFLMRPVEREGIWHSLNRCLRRAK